MGFTIKYKVTRCGFDGQISRTFTERYITRKAALTAFYRIEKEYAKSELTRLELIPDNKASGAIKP